MELNARAARRDGQAGAATARWRRRRSPRPTAASSTSRRADRGAELAARRQDADLQQRRPDLPHPGAGGTPESIDTGFATRCNNDHGVSPDGTTAGHQRPVAGRRQVAHLHAARSPAGRRSCVTPTGPSYWHGWSPDGKTLAFCGERDGEFDIYTIPADGGAETRLTTAKGLDDGPEYSPDGKTIYFNSDRTGTDADLADEARRQRAGAGHGRRVQQLVPAPLARRPVAGVPLLREGREGHPENKDVTLRLMTLADGKIDVLGRFFGGQGTINVPCWSPDGKKIACVQLSIPSR